jgi:lactate permease
MPWSQTYDPLGSPWLSTIGAALPIGLLLVTLAVLRWRAQWAALTGWRGLKGVWPAVLVSGGSFAIVQFFWSNYVGPELVDIVAGLTSLVTLAIFCARWRPATTWEFGAHPNPAPGTPHPIVVPS